MSIQRYFLIHKIENETRYSRTFPPLENNIVLKILLGSLLEQCIADKDKTSLDDFLNYILLLRKKLIDEKTRDLEVVTTETFKQ